MSKESRMIFGVMTLTAFALCVAVATYGFFLHEIAQCVWGGIFTGILYIIMLVIATSD